MSFTFNSIASQDFKKTVDNLVTNHGLIQFNKQLSKRQKPTVYRFDLAFCEEFYLQFYQSIQEWSIYQFSIPKKLDEQFYLFSCLSHITFNKLKKLDLQNSFIQSVQSFQWMGLRNLQQLNLKGNLIVSLKPLGKCSLKQLKLINIGQNKFNIISLHQMSSINLPIDIEIKVTQEQRNIFKFDEEKNAILLLSNLINMNFCFLKFNSKTIKYGIKQNYFYLCTKSKKLHLQYKGLLRTLNGFSERQNYFHKLNGVCYK